VKIPLGLWEGSTENASVATALLADLVERGLAPEQGILFVIDGAKALRQAIRNVFGDAPVQRCLRHKERNVTDHLPERERPGVKQRLRRAWALDEHGRALDQLRRLAGELDRSYPGAAGSLREGMEETLTLTRLGVSGSLKRTLESTNPCESMIEIVRHTQRNVKRWSSGEMALRWTAAGMLEAEKQFRKIIGYRDLATLVVAIERDHDRRRHPVECRSHLDQGESYRPHRLTIRPGPPPKIHGARDILRPSSCTSTVWSHSLREPQQPSAADLVDAATRFDAESDRVTRRALPPYEPALRRRGVSFGRADRPARRGALAAGLDGTTAPSEPPHSV
jgi:hypothetical protein